MADIRVTTTFDFPAVIRKGFEEGLGIARAKGSEFASVFAQAMQGGNVAAGFTQQGAEAATAFTKTFDAEIGRWRDANGKFTTPPVEVPVVQAPGNTPTQGPTSAVAKDKAELEAFLALQKQALRDMQALGQVGSEEFHLIQQSIKQAEAELQRMDSAAQKAAQDAQKASSSAKSSGGGGSSFGGAASGVLSSISGGLLGGGLAGAATQLADFAEKSVRSLERIERINAQTEQVIKSTGGAAGVSAEHVISLTGDIENLTATEAESIQMGANMLLTFTEIKNGQGENNQIFDRTLLIVNDVARAMDKTGRANLDTAKTALQLGKALNDPAGGFTKLKKIGVTFTEDQIKLGKEMAKNGDIAGAQKIILDELDKEFGGSAKKFGETTAGRVELAKHALGTLGESIVSGVLPVLGQVATGIADMANGIADVFGTGGLSGIFSGILDLAGGAKGGLLELAGFLLGGPIGAGIAFLLVKIDEGTGLFRKLGAIIKGIFQNAGPVISAFGELIKAQLNPANWFGDGTEIQDATKKLGAAVQQMGQDIGDNLQNSDLSAAITDAVAIKGDLDKNGETQKLLDKFNSLKDGAEKTELGKKLAADLPGAIAGIEQVRDASGQVTSQFKINAAAAQELIDANKGAFSAELASKQKEYADGLKNQVGQYERNRTALTALSKEIVANAANKDKVKELTAQYRELETKTNDTAKAIGETVKSGKDIGIATDSAAELQKQLGLSAEEAQNVVAVNAQIGSSAAAAAEDVAKIAEKYRDAKKEQQGLISDNRDAILQLTKERQALEAQLKAATSATPEVKADFQKRIDSLNEQIKNATEEARSAVKDKKRDERFELKLDLQLGIKDIKIDDLNKEAERIKQATAQIRAKLTTDNIADDSTRKLTEIQNAADAQIRGIEDKIKEVRAKAAKGGDDTKTVGLTNLVTALEDQQRAIQQKADDDKRKARDEANKKLLADFAKQFQDEAKLREEKGKSDLEIAKAQEDLITGESVDAITRRGALQRAAIRTNAELEKQAVIDSDKKIIDLQAQLKLAESQGNPFAAASIRKELAIREGEIRASNARIQLIDLQAAQATRKLTLEEEEKLQQARFELAIQGESLPEQERDRALRELELRLKKEQEAAEGNQAKLTEIERKGATERAKIEDDYLKSRNKAYQIALDIKKALEGAFTSALSKEEEKRLIEERSKNETSLQDLKEKYAKGLIDVVAYNTEIAKLAKDRAKIETDLAKDGSDKDAKIKAAGIRAAESFDKAREDAFAKSNEELLKLTDERDTLILSKAGKTGKELDDINDAIAAKNKEVKDKQGQALIDLSATAVSSFLVLAAQGENVSKQFGRLIFDLIEKAIPGLVALVFGQSIATLGPILGPIVSGALTGTLIGLAEIGKSAAGFKEGVVGYRGAGTATSDSNLVRISNGESVATARATQAPGTAPFLEWANKTGRGLHDYLATKPQLSTLVVDSSGSLAQRAYDTATAAHANTKVISEKLDAVADKLGFVHGRLADIADTNRNIAGTNAEMAKQKPESHSFG